MLMKSAPFWDIARRRVVIIYHTTPRNIPDIHVGFVVDKVALGQFFSPSTSVFPCQFHSTCVPLHGKRKKKTNHFHYSVAQ
jgi:hypothetical protein